MRVCKRLIKEGWGDPNWDYDDMNNNFDVWQDMKKTWDGVPEKKAVAAYVAQQNSCRPEKKPLYCITQPSAPLKIEASSTDTAAA